MTAPRLTIDFGDMSPEVMEIAARLVVAVQLADGDAAAAILESLSREGAIQLVAALACCAAFPEEASQ